MLPELKKKEVTDFLQSTTARSTGSFRSMIEAANNRYQVIDA
jgi:hypothetical protein